MLTPLLLALALPASAAPAAPELTAAFAAARTDVRAFAADDEEALIELLRDPDPQVRRTAVKALKSHVGFSSRAREAVTGVLRNAGEELEVRREAAKSLSAATADADAVSALLGVAQGGEASALRAIAWKALYWAARNRSEVRDPMTEAMRGEPDAVVRRGAIWGLFLSLTMPEVRDPLREIGGSASEEAATRVEALKSLYDAMGLPETRELAVDLARNTGEDREVRKAGILLLSRSIDTSERDVLRDIAANDKDSALRQAAVLALDEPGSDEIAIYFHRAVFDVNGRLVRDPLDAE